MHLIIKTKAFEFIKRHWMFGTNGIRGRNGFKMNNNFMYCLAEDVYGHHLMRMKVLILSHSRLGFKLIKSLFILKTKYIKWMGNHVVIVEFIILILILNMNQTPLELNAYSRNLTTTFTCNEKFNSSIHMWWLRELQGIALKIMGRDR